MGPASKIGAEEFRELASFWSREGDALSVYFQTPAPTELAQREEATVARSKIQRQFASSPGAGSADRADLQRVVEAIAATKGNHRRTKAIFACGRKKFWREYDVPGDFGQRIVVGNGFAVAPLLARQQTRRRYSIALVDRHKARLLLLEAKEIVEQAPELEAEEGEEKLRTTGARKSVHIERKKEERAGSTSPTWPTRCSASRAVSLCSNCQHLREGDGKNCDLCGHLMHLFPCAEEALMRHALGRSIHVRMLRYIALPPGQLIAAWLRFRGDRNTAEALAR